jgi:hypothetical protein
MKNNQKGFASMILIGAVIILVAVGGYFYWKSTNNKPLISPVTNITNSPSVTPSLSPSVSTTPTNITPTPFSPSKTGPADYRTDLNALITAARTCIPSKATVTTNTIVGPWTIEIMVDTENAQILGSVGQNCHFFSTKTDFNLIISQELANKMISSGQITQAQLDTTKQQLPTQINNYKKALIGATMDCTMSTADLVSFLQFWQTSNGEVTAQYNTLMTKYCKNTNPNEVIIH